MKQPRSQPNKLRYDWWGAYERLYVQPTPYPFRRLVGVLAVAQEFIERWADLAELVHMQPVHLLRNDPADPGGRGLAWRWSSHDVVHGADVVCFPRDRYVVADSQAGHVFVYRFDKDGRTVMVTGDERKDILQGPIEDVGLGQPRSRSLLVSSLDLRNHAPDQPTEGSAQRPSA